MVTRIDCANVLESRSESPPALTTSMSPFRGRLRLAHYNVYMRLAVWFVALAAAWAQPSATVQRLGAITPRMQALVDEGAMPGAAWLVLQHGRTLVQQAVGVQDLETRRPMRTDSIFQIMSMTKPMTAAALMMLVEEGRVVLADPVERYLPRITRAAGV